MLDISSLVNVPENPMICVLEVIEGPARGRRIWLRENECVEIGRVSSADFPIPADLHLSRRHLLLDSTKSGFRVRDMGSANGTFLNNSRIDVQEIHTGDKIRAGMTTFLVSLHEKGANPHAKDGVRFGSLSDVSDTDGTMSEEFGDSTETKHSAVRTIDFSKSELENTVRLVTENVSEPANPPELQPALKSSTMPANKWWSRLFQPTQCPGLYEQRVEPGQHISNFVDLFRKFSQEYAIAGVINRSQLDGDATDLLDYFSKAGRLIPITQTLSVVDLPNEFESRRLIEKCIGKDAMICVGNRQTPKSNTLKNHANAFSFPSLLKIYFLDHGLEFRKQLQSDLSLVLFEFDAFGKVGLWIPDFDM